MDNGNAKVKGMQLCNLTLTTTEKKSALQRENMRVFRSRNSFLWTAGKIFSESLGVVVSGVRNYDKAHNSAAISQDWKFWHLYVGSQLPTL